MAEAVRALGYVSLQSSVIDEWTAFATEGLGLMASETRVDGGLSFRLDEWAARLMVRPGATDVVDAVGWQVRDALALEDVEAHLTASGATVTRVGAEGAHARFVEDLIACEDPAGNRFEIFHSPLIVHDPLSVAPTSGFVTGPQGLGHVVLPAGNMPETFDFYRRVLGFAHRDSMLVSPPGVPPYRMRFLSCNRRHHSLALTEAETPTRLRHLMLNVGSVSDVGVGFERCQSKGVNLKTRIGQHSNDEMISFYLTSPGGFEFEYATGGLEIDDASWTTRELREFRLWGYEPLG